MLRKLFKWLAATFSVVVILLAIGIGLFRLLLPMIPHYHERIEAFASEAAGTPVRIEGIDARWGLDGPELRFRNAQLLTTDGTEPLLSAQTGSVILDLRTLLRQRQFRAAQILLNGLRLEVLRDAEGQWQIGGRSLKPGSGSLPTRLAVGLRNAQIVFRDELNQAGPWILDEVDLNVLLQDQHLSLDAMTKLPAELGGEIEASLEADGDFASPDTANWQAYVRGADLALTGWAGLLPKDRTIPSSGNGDVTVWLSMDEGRLQQANVQLDLQRVVLAKNQETIRLLDVVKGNFQFDRMDPGWEGSGRDIEIASGGVAWPTASFGMEQVGGTGEDGLFYADMDYLRLQDLMPLADWIPDEKIRTWLGRLRPRGVVEDFSFRLTREQGQTDGYSVRSHFSELGMNSADSIPGFDNLRGNLRMDAFGGRLQLDPESVVIDMPKILGRSVTTKRMNGVVVWRHSASGWRVVSDNIDLDHSAFRSSTNLELTLPNDDSAPLLDLHVDLSDVDVAGMGAFVPRPILKPDLAGWLETALVSGKVPSATIEWLGAVDNFPFDDGAGEFRIDAEFQDLEFAYAKKWPVARELAGSLSFRNTSMMAGVTAADLSGNLVSSASISIEEMRQPVLKLQVSADGMLDKLHSFLKSTPVVGGDDDPFRQVDISGIGTTEVDLELPLKARQNPDVTVTVSTGSAEVALHGMEQRLEQIEGVLTYRNGQFSGNRLTALVLGAPAVIDVAPTTIDTDEGPRRATVATARGQVSDQELGRLHKTLATMLQGGTTYTATATFPEKDAAMPVSVEIVSGLEGMAVTLPEPLAKSAALARNLVVTVALPEGGVRTDFIYADVANASINWLRNDDGPWVLDRGGIHCGTATARLPPDSGLVISGAPDRLDVAGWLGINDANKSDQRAPISSARLEVGKLDVYGQQLDDAVLSIDRSEREWLVQIDSQTVSGGLFIPFAPDDQPIIANLERLYIDTGIDTGTGTGTVVATSIETDVDPRKVPQMDIQADDFRLGEMKLGQMRAQLRSISDGIGLEQYESTASTFSIAGRGAWRIDQAAHSTNLEFKLLSTDVGPTLMDLDFDKSIDSAEAEIDFAVSWPGPPGPQFKEKLNGVVNVRVGAGQLQTLEPGAGRVFGLFSFTALPRRLSLDFRDVFDTGFGFDYIQGDFTLDNGDAFTSNLVLEGPAAQVGIAGRAGLVARDYDQTAVVYGNFGATLPVAGVIAGGPLGGAAMLIFSELFKKPLQDMAQVNYRISGSWDEPAIERVLASAPARVNPDG